MNERFKEPLTEQGEAKKPSAELLLELRDLLSKLKFSAEHADLRTGENWRVYARPWLNEEGDFFDVLIDIISYLPEIDYRRLRLWIDERGVDDDDESNISWLASSAINRRGQVWFKQLKKKGWYSARLLDTLPQTKPSAGEGSGLIRLAAEGNHDEPFDLDKGYPQPHKLFLSDRRIFALLEQGKSGHAVITIQTEAAELARTVVRFSIDGESGEAVLSPKEGVWSVYKKLAVSFQEAEACNLDFECVSASE